MYTNADRSWLGHDRIPTATPLNMPRSLFTVGCCLALISPVQGFDQIINIPPAPLTTDIDSDTQINILDGANIPWLRVPAGVTGVEVNVLGGVIRGDLTAESADRLVISGGVIGESGDRTRGKSVLMTGGTVQTLGAVQDLTVEGGSIALLRPEGQTPTTVRGGSTDWFQASLGPAHLAGGRVGRVRANTGSDVTIRGGDFRLNGVPTSGPISLGSNSSETDLVFTGVFEDGSSFIYSSYNLNPFSDTLVDVQLTEVPIPTAGSIVDLATDPMPNGLRPGQTLFAYVGDNLGDNYHVNNAMIQLGAGSLGERAKLLDSQLIIDGGSVGEDLMILPGSSVELRSGSVEDFHAVEGSSFRMLGGRLGSSAPFSTSTPSGRGMRFDLDGGEVIKGFSAVQSEVVQTAGSMSSLSLGDSIYRISGGRVDSVSMGNDSTALINGGSVGLLFTGISSSANNAAEVRGGRLGSLEGEAELYGRFEIDGVPATGEVNLPDGALLTGVLNDGTPLVLSSRFGDEVHSLNLIDMEPAPATAGVIVAPLDPIPSGLQAGQTLILGPGSDAGADFTSLGGDLIVAGGTVGNNATLVGGASTVSSGLVKSRLSAVQGANVVVAGGLIGDDSGLNRVMRLQDSSSLQVVGGAITDDIQLTSRSSATFVGGEVNRVIPVDGSSIRIAGDAIVGGITNQGPELQSTDVPVNVTIEGGEVGNVSLKGAQVLVSGGVVDNVSVGSGSSTPPRPAEATISGGQVGQAGAAPGGTLSVLNSASVGTVSAGTLGGFGPSTPMGVATIQGGAVADIESYSRGQVDIVSGTIASQLQANDGVININGGEVYNDTVPGQYYVTTNRVLGDGVVFLSGGAVTGGFDVERGSFGAPGATFEASGGAFGRLNRTGADAVFRLRGGDFLLNGEPVSGQVDPTSDYVLTGTLTDGTPFILSSESGHPTSSSGDTFAPGTLHLIEAALPTINPVINSPTDPVPYGIRAGQTLNLSDGAEIRSSFAAIDSTLNMSGGRVGYGLELLRTTSNVTGGEIGQATLLFDGGVLNLAGGEVDAYLVALSGSEVNLSGGRIGPDARFEAGSSLAVTGGATSPDLEIEGTASIRGGNLGRGLLLRSGGAMELVGSDFRLNGEPVSGSVVVQTNLGEILTGVLADGTPVLFGPNDYFQAPITLVDAPGPSGVPTVINSPTDELPRGLLEGQTLNLGVGATTLEDFTALGGTLNVIGGTVAQRLEAIGTRIHLIEGSIEAGADLYEGTVATISGSGVADELWIAPGVVASQIGGQVRNLRLAEGASFSIAGGEFNVPSTDDWFGQEYWSPEGSQINLFGLAFSQGDTDLLEGLPLGESIELSDRSQELNGVLAEGSEILLGIGGRRRSIGRGTFTLTKLLLGDFNHDGLVDTADYTLWRDTEGQTVEIGSGADHDFDGVITSNDRDVWASRFGSSIASTFANQATAVPEPSTLGIVFVMACQGARVRRQRTAR